LKYCPGDSDSFLFGGNSNWRGPIWFPINYLIIESLERFHRFYGDDFQVEYPTGSGQMHDLKYCANDIRQRLIKLFKADDSGKRPWHGTYSKLGDSPDFNDHQLFYEFFNGDTGTGHGASHQTGWTALVATLIKESEK